MSEAAPFFAEVADAPPGAQARWLAAADGTRLRAVAWPGGSRGTAWIFPGRTEYAEKYGRVAARLAGLGFSVAVIDWRGQGLSDRPPGKPELGHVEDFRDYQQDVAAFLAAGARFGLSGPDVMVAHSMGGCVGLRTLLERADFRAAVFSAPMWHLQMRAATRELTARMTRLAQLAGLGGRRMPGTHPGPTTLAIEFEGNALTGDREHFEWMTRQIIAHPELALGGPSVRWTNAALVEMARLYVAPLPRLPVLTFLGSVEEVVSTSVIRAQMRNMESGELVLCPGARHEIFMEGAETRTLVWDRIRRFLDAVCQGPPRQAAAEG